MMTKHIMFFIVIAFLLAWLLVPVPLGNEDGLYNKVTGLIWCTSRLSCVHEVAHALDHQAGWVSHSDAFGNAVQIYILFSLRSDQNSNILAEKIMFLPGVLVWDGIARDPQAEIYANIFEFSEGKKENMSEIFHDFYNWVDAEKMLEAIGEY